MKKWQKISLIVALILVGVSSAALFNAQAIGLFESDLGAHIESALDPTIPVYTITKPIYALAYAIGGNFGIAILLTAIELLTILITKKLIEHFLGSKNQFKLWIYAILLNFAIAIYLPFIHPYWNAGVQESVEWHNSTFICMKPLGLLTLLLFFQLRETYLKKIDYKKYALFCLTLIAVNSVKPNFILAFAPTMLVFLIIDFFQNLKDWRAIRNIIILGCAVLLSLPIILYQNAVLFTDDPDAGIVIHIMGALKIYHNYPIISLIQSATFPLFMLLTNLKTVFKNKEYSFVALMNFIALGTYLVFEETGLRRRHGNFDFGYCFALLPAFIAGLSLLENRRQSKTTKKAYLVVAYALLALHIISGIAYFIALLTGVKYYA